VRNCSKVFVTVLFLFSYLVTLCIFREFRSLRRASRTFYEESTKVTPHWRDGSVGDISFLLIANVGDYGLRHSSSTYSCVVLPPSADFPPRRGAFLPHLRCSARICIYKKPWVSENGVIHLGCRHRLFLVGDGVTGTPRCNHDNTEFVQINR